MHKTTVKLRGLTLEVEFECGIGCDVTIKEVYHKGEEILFLIDDTNHVAIYRDIERQIRERKCHI